MITLDSGSRNPFYNQAFEEYVFETFRDEEVLLLWRNDPAVIVGCYQNICREVHVPTLRRLGIPVVRRISGGGTVYHDAGNLNYSLMLPQTERINYQRCMEPVIRALNALGVPAYADRVCDIALDGRKISGSAQRSAGGRVLHHGTLLYCSDLTRLDAITTASKNACIETKGTPSAICRVTNIADHLARPLPLEDFARALREQILPPGSRKVELDGAQRAQVERLRDEKYRSWAWTWGKTPAFTYDRQGHFDGAPIHTAYTARKGILNGLRIESPRLAADAAECFGEEPRLNPEALLRVCCDLVGAERADALLECLL